MGGSRSALVRWWRLDTAARTAALVALWRLTAVTWWLRTRGFGDIRERIDSVSEPDAHAAPVSTAQLARIVDRLAHGVPWRTTCLHRSLALTWMLNERGVPAEMRIGVGRDGPDEALLFHAWVEVDGHVVNDSTEISARFAPFPGFVPPDAEFT